MFTSGLQALTAVPLSPSPRINMPGMRLWFQRPVEAIVNAQAGAIKAEAGFNRRAAAFFLGHGRLAPALNSSRARNLLAASALQIPAPSAQSQPTP
jgi:hypothetical protein